MQGAVRALRRFRGIALFGSLPRPAGVALAATTWPTLLILAWLTASALLRGGTPVGDAGATVRGQQLAAATWMIHFIAWCGIACRRLNRNRAAARMWRPADAHTSM